MPGSAPRIAELPELIEAVDKIRPVVEAGAVESEGLCALPQATLEAIRETGIFHMIVPRELGGLEADPVTQSEVIERLAYFDASAAWCGFIGAGSTGFVAANLPQAGLEEVLAHNGGRWPVFAGSPTPTATARRVPGGFEVAGRWGYASGIRHADFVFAGFMVEDEGEPARDAHGVPLALAGAIPISEVDVEDTWDTMGLRGTGSTHFSSPGVFVPEQRTFGFPMSVPQRGGAVFRLPVLGFFGPAFSGFPQGVARRALDEIMEIAQTKTRIMAGVRLAERGVFQRDLALADGNLRAARLLLHHELDALWQRLHDGVEGEALDSARLLYSFSHNAQTASDAVDMAFRYGGAEALYRTGRLQRLKRDMNSAAQHILVGEHNFESLGRAMLGL